MKFEDTYVRIECPRCNSVLIEVHDWREIHSYESMWHCWDCGYILIAYYKTISFTIVGGKMEYECNDENTICPKCKQMNGLTVLSDEISYIRREVIYHCDNCDTYIKHMMELFRLVSLDEGETLPISIVEGKERIK